MAERHALYPCGLEVRVSLPPILGIAEVVHVHEVADLRQQMSMLMAGGELAGAR